MWLNGEKGFLGSVYKSRSNSTQLSQTSSHAKVQANIQGKGKKSQHKPRKDDLQIFVHENVKGLTLSEGYLPGNHTLGRNGNKYKMKLLYVIYSYSISLFISLARICTPA